MGCHRVRIKAVLCWGSVWVQVLGLVVDVCGPKASRIFADTCPALLELLQLTHSRGQSLEEPTGLDEPEADGGTVGEQELQHVHCGTAIRSHQTPNILGGVVVEKCIDNLPCVDM